MTHIATPPDPHPQPPKVPCPPGAVDTHVHVIGPQSEFPLIDNPPYVTDDATLARCSAMHQAIGVDFGVVVSAGAYGRSCAHLVDVLEQAGGRLRGVAVPPATLTPTEIDRLHTAGVRGIRFASDRAGNHVAHIEPGLARAVSDWGWHVDFIPSAGAGELERHAERLLDLPTDVVIDHFGRVQAPNGREQSAVQCLLRMLDTGKVWVKISGPMYCSPLDFPYSDLDPIAKLLVSHAPERILWGTDWPHLHMGDRTPPNDGGLIDLLHGWVGDRANSDRILVENPHHLYGFD